MKDQRIELHQAQTAESLRQILSDDQQRERELDKTHAVAVERSKEFMTLGRDGRFRPEGLDFLHPGQLPSLQLSDTARSVLDGCRKDLARHAASINEARQNDDAAQKALADEDELRRSGRRLRGAARSASDQLHRAKRDLAAAKSAGERLCDLRTVAGQLSTRADAAAQLGALRDERCAAARHLRSVEQMLRDQHKTALDRRERYMDGIAAELARTLKSGDPCPVCGSDEHPDKARASDDSVSRDEVDAAEASVKEAGDAVDQARSDHEHSASPDRSRELVSGSGLCFFV